LSQNFKFNSLLQCTVTSPECTASSGQRGVTDTANGYSGW